MIEVAAFLEILGAVGAAVIIVCYFMNQQGWLGSNSARYLLANAFGAGCILLSLVAEWNLPSAIIEGFWLLISLYGLGRLARR